MSFGMLRQTRNFGGKRYDLVGRYYTKPDAEKKAKMVRGYGKKARVVHEDILGGPPYSVWSR